MQLKEFSKVAVPRFKNRLVGKKISLLSAYLQTDNKNIIIVDWGNLAPLPCYPIAAVNTKFAAKCTANFLIKLKLHVGKNFRLNKIHAIGFSLGAHVASFVSNLIFKRTGLKFERITGKLMVKVD